MIFLFSSLLTGSSSTPSLSVVGSNPKLFITMGKPMSSVPIKGKPQNILDTSFGYARIVLFSIGTTDAILLYSKYLN